VFNDAILTGLHHDKFVGNVFGGEMSRRFFQRFIVRMGLMFLIWVCPAFCQTNVTDGPWSGQVVCQLNMQTQGYTRQETQTWTITNGAPKPGPGTARLFPATWTVTGTGSVQKTQNGQAFTAQWNTNVPSTNGTISVFIRASDGRLIFRQGHSQLRNEFSLRGTRQSMWNGQQQQPAALASPTWEWQLPWMEADPSDPNPSGTFSVSAEALPAELTNPPSLPRIANCNWHFSKGTAGHLAVPSNGSNSSNSGATPPSTRIMNPNYDGPSNDPTISKIDPSSASQGTQGLKVTLTGRYTNFSSNLTTVDFGPGITVLSPVTVNTPTSVTVTLNIYQNAAPGGRTVSMVADTYGDTAQSVSGFTVNAAPTQTGAGGNSSSGSTPSSSSQNSGSSQNSNSGQNSGSSQNSSGCLQNSADIIRDFTSMKTDVEAQFDRLIQEATDPATKQSLQQQKQQTLASLEAQEQNDLQSTSNGCPAGGSSGTQTGSAQNTQGTSNSNPGNTSTNGTTSNSGQGNNTSGATNPSGTTNPPTGSTSGANPKKPTYQMPTQIGKQIPSTPVVTQPPASGATSTATSKPVVNGPAKSPSTAAPKSGNYLVKVNGMVCLVAASSSDAVYVGAAIRQYDRRSSQNTMSTNADTWVYGDVNNMQGQRKQAGTRSPTGGIGNGDVIPPGFSASVQNTLPAQANLLPLLLWQGTLTDGADVVVISPSLWINYGDRQLFSQWHQNEQSFNNSLLLDPAVQNQIQNSLFGTILVGSSTNSPGSTVQNFVEQTVNDANTADIVQGAALGGPLGLSTGLIVSGIIAAASHPGIDRPFGLADSNLTTVVLPNTTIVLTREIIEKRLGSNSWALLPVNLIDSTRGLTGGDRPGSYLMFVQIERQQ